MKIRDLIKQTGVPRQTIHYYIQNGLVPKPQKTGRNSAEYSQRHVDRIRLVRELQDNYFLPLTVIKKILRKYGRDAENESSLKVQREFFRPVEQLLAGNIEGEAAFLAATGLRPERLADYEAWGIITPEAGDGDKVYSYDDQVIGRVIAQWREIGLTSEKGFPPDILQTTFEAFREIVAKGGDYYWETARRTFSLEEIQAQSGLLIETTALFFYRMYRKLARLDQDRRLAALAVPPPGDAPTASGEPKEKS